MRSKNREALLKIGVGVVVGLFALDRLVVSPSLALWKEQSARIDDLREKVNRGRQLIEREKSLRGRWAEMQRTDLPEDASVAESEVIKAINRWAQASHVGFTNFNPTWRSHEDGYDTYECRASASGDQAALSRLLYEIETDPLPARMHDIEFTARDAKGKQLNLSARFSFVRLTAATKNAR